MRTGSLVAGKTGSAPRPEVGLMKLFVTGGSGFIGAHLCRALVEAGHRVAVLSREGAPWRLRDIRSSLALIRGGLDDIAAWHDELADFRPDAVAHAAWRGVANFDRDAPSQVDNIGWTAALVAQAAAAGASTFLGLGSQAEYGPKSTVIGPDDQPAPTTLYGEAKLAAGRIAGRIAAQAGLRFVWMRIFSTYGPTDHPYWLIPGLIGQLLQGSRPPLTRCEQCWDFLHVADAAHAIRLALESASAQGIYTLGSGAAPPLRRTVERVRDRIDPALPLGFGEIPYRPDQVMRLQADVRRLQDDLGWAATTPLEQGLDQTVDWYRANPWVFATERAVNRISDGGAAPWQVRR
jgi:UDP-glucose 4-epimerase